MLEPEVERKSKQVPFQIPQEADAQSEERKQNRAKSIDSKSQNKAKVPLVQEKKQKRECTNRYNLRYRESSTMSKLEREENNLKVKMSASRRENLKGFDLRTECIGAGCIGKVSKNILEEDKNAHTKYDETKANSVETKKKELQPINIQDTTLESTSQEQEIFYVERIKKRRTKNGKSEYLIKWQGLTEKENTWEPPENLNLEIIKAYEEKQNYVGKRTVPKFNKICGGIGCKGERHNSR